MFFSPALQIKEVVDFSGLLFSLVSCSEECGNSSLDASALSFPLCFQLQTQLLKARLNLTPEDHQRACPPSNVVSATSVESPRREKKSSEGAKEFTSQNCALPVS
ncbi:hypothetical protein XENOCAPTIV_015419 [Xenoophorus captivus]|uniref:Uncharacterized protein n=1 Tax=Xenoophorus captivus TaxID=1517983 RepID=A0ABV0RQT7_9TELE